MHTCNEIYTLLYFSLNTVMTACNLFFGGGGVRAFMPITAICISGSEFRLVINQTDLYNVTLYTQTTFNFSNYYF